MTEEEISLFPIPESVNLPYTVLPLHIFEPRYRKLIKDSIAANRRIGVAHTKRKVAPAHNRPDADLETILNSNQESYEAYEIFSAGFAENLETLPDGRLIVQIEMDRRFEIIEELQQIPYKIVKCRSYDDLDKIEDETEIAREQLDKIILRLPGENLDKLKDYIRSPAWKSISTREYSFRIYQVIRFEADTLQKVLEMKSAIDRIEFLSGLLQNKTN